MAYWLEGASVRQKAHLSPQLASATNSYIGSPRARLRFALLLCLACASLLSFVLFPARRVTITADGNALNVVSREDDAGQLLEKAGIEQVPGDVLVRSDGALSVERAIPVVVEVDGQMLGWRTRSADVKGVLSELGIEVNPYDTVIFNGVEAGLDETLAAVPLGSASASGFSVTSSPLSTNLSIVRAVPLTIIEDGLPISFQSSKPTLAMALQDAGIHLGPADEVYPSVTSEITAGMEVEVKHAKAISLRTGTSTQVVYTHLESLQEALAEAGYALGADDRVEPSVETAVTNGMTARLVRVGGRTFTEREKVLKKTVFQPDEGLQGSATRIVQGSDGQRVREYRVVIEDGVEVQRELTREGFEPEPVDTVIYYAAASVRATGLEAQNFNVVKTDRMYATWYNAASSGKTATDPAYGITKSGVPVTKGIVATDPKVIPLGTRLYVPGYGFAVAGDTGGGIIGNMIDLGYPDGVAVDWHTGWVDVYVLGP